MIYNHNIQKFFGSRNYLLFLTKGTFHDWMQSWGSSRDMRKTWNERYIFPADLQTLFDYLTFYCDDILSAETSVLILSQLRGSMFRIASWTRRCAIHVQIKGRKTHDEHWKLELYQGKIIEVVWTASLNRRTLENLFCKWLIQTTMEQISF